MALLAFLLAALRATIGVPLLDPDEGRNAEVAREMREAGEWIVPQLHGLPYLDKPALYFDIVALSFGAFGKGETAARLPSVFFAAGALAVTWLLARRLAGRRRADLAVAILATVPLFVLFARTVIFDIGLTFFITTAIWLAEEGRAGHRWAGPLAWVAIALAVLTKGPVGLLLPLLAIVALALGKGRPYRLGRVFHPLGIVLFVACVAPWIWTVERREPGFLRYALVVETVERLTKPTFHRTGPVWYYAPILSLGLFPWSLAALARIPAWARGVARGGLARPSADRGVLAAVAVIVLFFSLSRSKLGGYVLPAFPLIAILLAGETEGLRARSRAWTLAPGGMLLAIGIASIAAALAGLPLDHWMRQPAALGDAIARLFGGIGVVCAASGIFLLAVARRPRLAPYAMSLTFPLMIAVSMAPILRYVDVNSSRALADAVRARGGAVAAVRCFPTGLDYYLDRVVPVVTDSGREITSTYVERNFDRIAGPGAGQVWRAREFEARLRADDIDTRLLITRNEEPPTVGYRIEERIGRWRLWGRESRPPVAGPSSPFAPEPMIGGPRPDGPGGD